MFEIPCEHHAGLFIEFLNHLNYYSYRGNRILLEYSKQLIAGP